MTKKNTLYLIIAIILFFGILFTYNLWTYYGVMYRSEYCYGEVYEIKREGRGGRHWYSYYRYQVDGTEYSGKQGGRYTLTRPVVIVYDRDKPQFSMIAKYSALMINANGDTLPINPDKVSFSWWDYLPNE